MKIKFITSKIKEKYKIECEVPGISAVSTLTNPQNNSLVFCIEYKKQYEEPLSLISNSVILVNEESVIPERISRKNLVIHVRNPRLEYVYILNNCVKIDKTYYPESSYYIDPSSIVENSCIIEPNVFIGKHVQIGKSCHIKSGVKIHNNTIIGNNCVIGCNSVIGDIGFGIERINDEKWSRVPFEGRPMKMPHFGGVSIGDNVEIGSLNTIVSGAIEPTIIKDNVKTDDHVHIAHNCTIGDGVLIAAAAEISGGVSIGNNTWVGPNSSVFQQASIGEKCLIGIGANIFKDMQDGDVYMGTPARKIRKSGE